MTTEQWDQALRVNLSAPFFLTRAVLAPMIERGYGRIVHVSSVTALMGSPVEAGIAFLPLMLIGLPRLYGCWHMVMVGLLQHGGLADNVLDHRLNSRTVYMNPISRFIYWNMNYHVEHHMYPMVPYHALPRLHELIKHDLPAANPTIVDAYREMIGIFLKALRMCFTRKVEWRGTSYSHRMTASVPPTEVATMPSAKTYSKSSRTVIKRLPPSSQASAPPRTATTSSASPPSPMPFVTAYCTTLTKLN